jgi:hypothetical protein
MAFSDSRPPNIILMSNPTTGAKTNHGARNKNPVFPTVSIKCTPEI